MSNVYLKVLEKVGVLLPMKGEPGSIGLDLHAAEEAVIPAGGFKPVNTELQVEFDFDSAFEDESNKNQLYMKVESRSGTAYKKGIFVIAGVIDQSYRGEIKVILCNFGEEDYEISKGDRIAQGIIYECPAITSIRHVDVLSKTMRGQAGFGSTGK